MEQLSMFKNDNKSIKSSITKEMHIAIKKGIIPGAIVIFDNCDEHKYTVSHLFIDNDKKLSASLRSDSDLMSWHISSERLTVIGYYDEK